LFERGVEYGVVDEYDTVDSKGVHEKSRAGGVCDARDCRGVLGETGGVRRRAWKWTEKFVMGGV
jgi:hypothetical protein